MLSNVVAKLWTEAPAEQRKLTTQVLPPSAVRTLCMPLSDPSAAPSFASSHSPLTLTPRRHSWRATPSTLSPRSSSSSNLVSRSRSEAPRSALKRAFLSRVAVAREGLLGGFDSHTAARAEGGCRYQPLSEPTAPPDSREVMRRKRSRAVAGGFWPWLLAALASAAHPSPFFPS